jgi:predicted component of type VI protein secretion system
MAIELRIAGPGLDLVRTLEVGDRALILGRDPDCDVCLPDPQRNVSRRHLSVWAEAGDLHFRVLSVVNGVDVPSGEVAPGAQGVLSTGQTLVLADYRLRVDLVSQEGKPQADPDPWSVFEGEESDAVPAPEATLTSLTSSQEASFSASASAEGDPFGDWGFETTFGDGVLEGEVLEGGGTEGGLRAFFQGLSMDPASLGRLSPVEIEAIGKLVRVLLLGMLELHAGVKGVQRDLGAQDRTMVAAKDTNPLKTDWPEDTKLRYLFGGRAAGIGFMSPERALRELLDDLTVHESATAVALRDVLTATLKEFEPAALKSRLLGDAGKLFEGHRAWNAYQKFYEEQGPNVAVWAVRLLDRYFTDAYLRESLRIRRETAVRRR